MRWDYFTLTIEICQFPRFLLIQMFSGHFTLNLEKGKGLFLSRLRLAESLSLNIQRAWLTGKSRLFRPSVSTGLLDNRILIRLFAPESLISTHNWSMSGTSHLANHRTPSAKLRAPPHRAHTDLGSKSVFQSTLIKCKMNSGWIQFFQFAQDLALSISLTFGWSVFWVLTFLLHLAPSNGFFCT